MSSQRVPRCPRCGSRLFLESDLSRGGRLIYVWECSLGCSRQWDLSGRSISQHPDERALCIADSALAPTGDLLPVG